MSDLKKVGLIFKADGSADFVKSIRSVNAEIRENYQQMKITQASWDETTKKSDKLRDRVANLSRAYELNEKKLTVLNEELKELKENENATEDQIKSKEAQIRSTEAANARYEKSIKNINKSLETGVVDIEAYGKKLQDTGKKITDAGKKASVFSAAYVAAMTLAVKKASDWETAWTDVLKVTDGTEDQLNNLSKSIRNMSQELPVSSNEIAGVVEAASKLGVGIEHVESFAKTMVKMEIATGISAADSSTALARFAEITRMSFDDVERLGSVIAYLGDSYATTEKEIIDMSMGLAAAGSQVGMSQADIMALATALSSVGLEAQAGGSAMSKLMVNMELATKTGKGLTDFAKVAGVSGSEFAKIFEKDATKAISMFISGLDGINKDGGSAIKVLDDMGIKEVRLRDTLLRAANASETFTGAIEDGSKAWEENTKLTEEAELQAGTLANQWQLTKNMLEEIAITFGEIAMPVIKDFVEWIQKILISFQSLSPVIQKTIVIVGAVLAAVGPLLIFIGKLVGAVGTIVANWGAVLAVFAKVGAVIGAVTAKIGVIIAFIGKAGAAIASLATPIGAIIAIVAVITAVIIKNWETVKQWTLDLISTITEKFSEFGSWFVETWNSLKESVVNIFISIGEFFTEFWNTTIETISNFVTKTLEILNWPIEFVKNALLLIVALLAIALEKIYTTIIEPMVEFFRSAFDTINEFIQSGIEWAVEFINTTIETIKEFFQNAFNWIMETIITPFHNFFTDVFNKISDLVDQVVTNIKNAFHTGIEWIKTTIIAPLVGFFNGVWNNILNGVKTAVERIKSAFKTVSTFVSSVFNAVKSTIVNVFSSIAGIIKAPINGVVSVINGVLRSLNKIKIPSWVPGLGGVGINFPMVPFLAKGGILEGAAIVGEAGPELLSNGNGKTTVTPLSDGGGARKRTIDIDYKKQAQEIRKALTGMRFVLDEDGFLRLVDDYLLEVL